MPKVNDLKLEGTVHKLESRETRNGGLVFSGLLRFNVRQDKKTEEWVCDFIKFKAFHNVAVAMQKSMEDKAKALLDGCLFRETWKDKEGNNREMFYVYVKQFSSGGDDSPQIAQPQPHDSGCPF